MWCLIAKDNLPSQRLRPFSISQKIEAGFYEETNLLCFTVNRSFLIYRGCEGGGFSHPTRQPLFPSAE
jgi:hypothetical protein